MTKKFEIIESLHGLPGISAEGVSDDERDLIRSIMSNQFVNSTDYQLRSPAQAFLQSDGNGYILIEFWTADETAITKFVDYLNQRLGLQ